MADEWKHCNAKAGWVQFFACLLCRIKSILHAKNVLSLVYLISAYVFSLSATKNYKILY